MVCYFLILLPLPVILPPFLVLIKNDECGEKDRAEAGEAHTGEAEGRAGGGKLGVGGVFEEIFQDSFSSRLFICNYLITNILFLCYTDLKMEDKHYGKHTCTVPDGRFGKNNGNANPRKARPHSSRVSANVRGKAQLGKGHTLQHEAGRESAKPRHRGYAEGQPDCGRKRNIGNVP